MFYRANLPALNFSPNDSIGSRLNGGHLGSIEYKYPVHGHKIHSLATVNYQLPRGETLFHLPLTHILEIFKHSSLTTRKYSETFSPAINSSNQQPQSTAAINSSNQQQQSTAAINNSNQQQQSTAAINSSNQQQQSTATINISNDQLSSCQQYLHNPRRPPLVTNTVPSRGYVLIEVDLGLAAR